MDKQEHGFKEKLGIGIDKPANKTKGTFNKTVHDKPQSKQADKPKITFDKKVMGLTPKGMTPAAARGNLFQQQNPQGKNTPSPERLAKSQKAVDSLKKQYNKGAAKSMSKAKGKDELSR